MKICPNCEREIEDNYKECPNCGHWLGWEENL